MRHLTLSLLIEKTWPTLLSVLFTAAWFWLADKPFPSAPDSLFGAAATVSSIFASFLGVAEAIILSIKGTPAFEVLVKLNYANLLFKYIASCVISSVLFAALSIIGFFVEPPIVTNTHVYDAFKVAWIYSGFLSIFTYTRIARLFFKLLKQ